MKELLEKLVAALVDEPEAMSIKETTGNNHTIYSVQVAGSDMGKLIGRQGQNIKAIRRIVDNAARRNKKRVTVEIQG